MFSVDWERVRDYFMMLVIVIGIPATVSFVTTTIMTAGNNSCECKECPCEPCHCNE